MRFTLVILSALFCLNASASSAKSPIEDKTSDEALVAAAEKLVSEAPAAKAGAQDLAEVQVQGVDAQAQAEGQAKVPDAAQALKAEAKESDIPVFLDVKKTDKSLGTVAWRLVASLALIAVVGGGMVYASRKWTRSKDRGGAQARIEMMHQFHMGPRKSVALIRVAGETLLIGVTEQNVNFLKTVVLIDDELEGVFNQNLNGFLDDEFTVEDARTALNSRA